MTIFNVSSLVFSVMSKTDKKDQFDAAVIEATAPPIEIKEKKSNSHSTAIWALVISIVLGVLGNFVSAPFLKLLGLNAAPIEINGQSSDLLPILFWIVAGILFAVAIALFFTDHSKKEEKVKRKKETPKGNKKSNERKIKNQKRREMNYAKK
jgi:preprotein translocase subunit SecG